MVFLQTNGILQNRINNLLQKFYMIKVPSIKIDIALHNIVVTQKNVQLLKLNKARTQTRKQKTKQLEYCTFILHIIRSIRILTTIS